MIRGLYTAASGMIVENRQQQNISQNLANMNTVGFKQLYLASIAQEEGTVTNDNGRNTLGTLTMKVGTDAPDLMMAQGDLRATDEPYDFALDGEGFFTLDAGNGERYYTRDGRFGVNNQGQLVSKEGYPVLMTNGQPAVVNQTEFSINSDGAFNVEGRNYQFMISTVDNPNQLVQQGDNNFTYGGEVEVSEDYLLYKGMVEGSNVNITDALVNLMTANRALQSNSKVLQSMDEMLAQSVQIGRI